jgi:hypothetical protein
MKLFKMMNYFNKFKCLMFTNKKQFNYKLQVFYNNDINVTPLYPFNERIIIDRIDNLKIEDDSSSYDKENKPSLILKGRNSKVPSRVSHFHSNYYFF